MNYEMIAEQIKSLPELYIFELGDFIACLKLKAKFQDFERQPGSYRAAIMNWRDNSKSLFENPEDAAFMETAFTPNHDHEPYRAKEIW